MKSPQHVLLPFSINLLVQKSMFDNDHQFPKQVKNTVNDKDKCYASFSLIALKLLLINIKHESCIKIWNAKLTLLFLVIYSFDDSPYI